MQLSINLYGYFLSSFAIVIVFLCRLESSSISSMAAFKCLFTIFYNSSVSLISSYKFNNLLIFFSSGITTFSLLYMVDCPLPYYSMEVNNIHGFLLLEQLYLLQLFVLLSTQQCFLDFPHVHFQNVIYKLPLVYFIICPLCNAASHLKW